MADQFFVGIDLGGTNIKAGVCDEHAKILSKLSVPTLVDEGRDAVIGRILSTAEQAIAKSGVGRKQIAGIGIGSPGPLSHRRGLIINPGNLPPLKDTPIRSIVKERTGINTTLENDANAAAWGEYWAGAGKGVKDLVMFTLGTGVGGGVISEGRMLRGHFENGGELGHILIRPDGRICSCGQRGCVEAHSSAHFLAMHAVDLVKSGRPSVLKQRVDAGQPVTSEDVVNAAKGGDELAQFVWNDACYCLAATCVIMQHATNPERIVLAGGLIAAGEFLLGPIQKYFRQLTWKLLDDFPEILFATLGNDAGLIGAAGCAFEANRTGEW